MGKLFGWSVGWVLGHVNLSRLFNTKSIFIQIISSIFKQLSLAWVHILMVKSFLFQAIQFIRKVLIQPIQLCVSIDFVYS